jgi:hypothetical protein
MKGQMRDIMWNVLGMVLSLMLGQRPDTRIADILYIVGDWVGKEGMLSNASIASAKHAAQLILNG